ncbi:hypothetical protein [Methanobrevibacter sp.]|uniref:hypothetical protein n=1 Tax=Methanobrevibacter sp. TaxID=66852 RepID=UPI00386E59B4
MNALNRLQERNDNLKSKLLHEQLKYGNYKFRNFRSESLLVLGAYRKYKSIFKAASAVGINRNLVIKWFIQGQFGNPHYRDFYLGIQRINGFEPIEVPDEVEEVKKDYILSEFDDAWTYTTFVDGKKISIISGNLDNLKAKIQAKDLPFNE